MLGNITTRLQEDTFTIVNVMRKDKFKIERDVRQGNLS